MNTASECFDKVKTDCFKFIKSQETSKEKFKGKEKMLKSFLIPACFWISSKAKSKHPFILGLVGGQGTGKTTTSSILEIILKKYFKLNVFKISIDDFYKTRKERLNLSKKIHPLLMTRGVPGTHDINIMLDFFKKSKSRNFKPFKLPKFNKAIDDRCKKNQWYTLKKSINSMEKSKDTKLIWRKYVNNELKSKYKKLYDQLDCLIYLKAQSFSLLQKWRLIQEKKLWLKNKNKKTKNKIMTKEDVLSFMQTYQRVTQNMFKFAPKYASIIFNLNSDHQIKSAIYKK